MAIPQDKKKEVRELMLKEEIRALVREHREAKKWISLETYQSLRMNSYERLYLLNYVSHEALIWITENCLKHCERSSIPPITYDDNLKEELVPELLTRLKVLHNIDSIMEER